VKSRFSLVLFRVENLMSGKTEVVVMAQFGGREIHLETFCRTQKPEKKRAPLGIDTEQ
jgi:hypothetical protein